MRRAGNTAAPNEWLHYATSHNNTELTAKMNKCRAMGNQIRSTIRDHMPCDTMETSIMKYLTMNATTKYTDMAYDCNDNVTSPVKNGSAHCPG